MNRPFAEIAYAVARFVFGMSLALLHGYDKLFNGKVYGLANTLRDLGFPHPLVFAWCAGAAEFFGGLFVAVGFLTRPALAFAAFTMIVAIYRHRQDGLATSELALLYLTMMLLSFAFGAGPYALDRVLGLRSPFVRKSTLDA